MVAGWQGEITFGLHTNKLTKNNSHLFLLAQKARAISPWPFVES
jgi:hypothetical protein